MRFLSWLAVVLLGLIAALPAWAEDPVFSHPVTDNEQRQAKVQALAERISDRREINGRFVQSKHLSVLSRPIESEGRFALDGRGRFQWDIREPFPLSYRFDGERLIRTRDGQSETLGAADDPSLYGFFAFISSLFQQSDGDLAEHFERFYDEDDEGWTLGLRPRDERLRQALTQLVVTGRGARIEQAVLTEPGGDYTRLQFSYPESSATETDSTAP